MAEEELVPTDEAIETVLGMLRQRMKKAFQNGQKVKAHAHSRLKPGTTTFKEDDGDFYFSLWIEAKK